MLTVDYSQVYAIFCSEIKRLCKNGFDTDAIWLINEGSDGIERFQQVKEHQEKVYEAEKSGWAKHLKILQTSPSSFVQIMKKSRK